MGWMKEENTQACCVICHMTKVVHSLCTRNAGHAD